MAEEEVQWLAGGIVSVDPVVTYTLPPGRSVSLGIAQCHPDLFRGRGALHLVGFASATENAPFAALAAKHAELTRQLVDNRIVFVANDDYGAFLLSQHGLPTILGNNIMFVDERVFKPTAPGRESFDAVYNARFLKMKRHELVAGIDSLMLIYYAKPDPLGPDGERVRQVLGKAFYANQTSEGGYRRFLPSAIPKLLGQCRVGLCLSASEGSPRALMEYLMCGLMVVSTKSVGGRSRYLLPPFARVVDDNADTIARAVRELTANPIPKAAIRDHIGRIVSFERFKFLEAVNRIVKVQFPIAELFSSVDPFLDIATRWRTVAQIVEPLESA
jgi:glycosyltransferase involved in cell wall biosynthesis